MFFTVLIPNNKLKKCCHSQMKLIDHRTIPDQQPKNENQHTSVEMQQINTRVNHQIMGDENRAKTRLDNHNLKTIF